MPFVLLFGLGLLGLLVFWLIPLWIGTSWVSRKGRNPMWAVWLVTLLGYFGLIAIAFLHTDEEQQAADQRMKREFEEVRSAKGAPM